MIFKKFINFLKKKWEVNTRDLLLIMLSFSMTGTAILFIRSPLFKLLHLANKPLWLIILLYPFIMIPVFYILLLVYGTILGKKKFFVKMIIKKFKFFD